MKKVCLQRYDLLTGAFSWVPLFYPLAAGYLGDRRGNRSAVALVTRLLTGPAILGRLLSQDVTSVILFMRVVLFLNAATTNCLIVLLFDLFPVAVLGITVASFAGVCGGSGEIGDPIILGHFYDQTGSFFWGFCALAMGAAVSALVLVPIAVHTYESKKKKRRKPIATKFQRARSRGAPLLRRYI
jgi:MFS family permease